MRRALGQEPRVHNGLSAGTNKYDAATHFLFLKYIEINKIRHPGLIHEGLIEGNWDLDAGDRRLGVTLRLAGDGLPPVHMFLLEAPLPAALTPALPDKVLDPGPGPGVHHVTPVSARADRQLLEPLDQQHARVADLA